MMRQITVVLAVVLVAACSHKSGGTLPLGAPAPSSAAPDRLFGIVLRHPLGAGALFGQRCFTGRQFAFEDGVYDIVSDDILASATEEHQDTNAVLAALDSLTACRGRARELGASAIVTLSDSVVGHLLIYWPDGAAPSYDRMVFMLTETFGEPYQNSWGVRFWAADSMAIYVNKRSLFGDGTSLALSDARLCERYERLVHAHNTRDRHSYPCWKEPERLDPGEVFTDPPVPLRASDLTVAGVAHNADSAEVRRVLGEPASRDTSSWTYPDLRVWFKDGRVNVIALTTARHATARGLRVGDRAASAKAMYGSPCIRDLWLYCRAAEPDGYGMMLGVTDHIITVIRVGHVVVFE